ncbi:response regulator [Pseudomonas sp. RC10]|uniref:response regulator transcription factor n=1 Tax=Pseudomonas bambusae TaxID=3139142 RepID=UPI003139C6F3
MSLLHSANQDEPRPHPDVLAGKVFIVDDDVSVREALESLIRHTGLQVKSFSCAQRFLDYPHLLEPCCLLLDVSMPGVTGLELQQSIAVDKPAMPIIFITGREDARTIVQAMKAGAVEFLTKPLDIEKLLDAIQSAIARSELLVRHEVRKATVKARYRELTRREREVFALVVEGLLNREIGNALSISEITVKAHRGQVMRKMEANTLAELFRIANEISPRQPFDQPGS